MTKLKAFQTEKVNDLTLWVRKLLGEITSDHQAMKTVVFEAPTGSGKTLMLANFVKKLVANFINSQKGISFVWLTPGKGTLHIQSKEKLDQELSYSGIDVVYFEDINNQKHFPHKTVAVLNWEKISKKDNKLTRANEYFNLTDFVQETNSKNNLIAIVDEEHYAKTDKTDKVIEKFNPKVVVRCSATPKTLQFDQTVFIPRQHAVDAQLIRKRYIVNPDIQASIIDDPLGDDLVLLKLALKKRNALHDAFKEANSKVNPLIVVQLPDEKSKWETKIRKDAITFFKKSNFNITIKNGLLAIHLDNEKQNLENLKRNDAKPIVIITKQAIAQGWDCPRAQILVKLRYNSEKRFNIQTLGRICRVPEVKRGFYDNDDLNYGYVYTFDRKILKINDGRNSENSITTDFNLVLKPEWKEKKILETSLPNQMIVRFAPAKDDSYATFAKKFNQWLRKVQDLSNFLVSSKEIKDFLQNLTSTPINQAKIFRAYESGQIAGNWLDKKTDTKEVEFEYRGEGLSFLRDRFNNAFATFLANNLQNKQSSFIEQTFEYLFSKNPRNRIDTEKKDKDWLYDFKFYSVEDPLNLERNVRQAAFFCFLINTKDRWLEWLKSFYKFTLNDEVAKTNSQLLNPKYEQKFYFTEFKKYLFPILSGDSINMNLETFPDPNNNLYQNFVRPYSPHFSKSERDFINVFLESYGFTREIDWWYRNVENESTSWKIIYLDKDNFPRNFYPDFLVKFKNSDKVWVIETKDTSGLDTNNSHKFAYLKKFCDSHQQLNFAFVIITPDNKIKFNNSEWSNDFSSSSWKRIELIFEE